jgi:hypothetical protein
MLAHGIQLLQCRLSTSIPIYLVKHVKIWLDFLHVCVHVKHGIVPLVIHDIMCTRSPTLLPFHWKIDSSLNGTSSTMWYRVVWAFTSFAHEKYLLEKFVISLHLNAFAIQPSTLALLRTITLSFFNSLSWLYIHLNYTGLPTLAFQGKCTSKCCITLNHLGGNIFSILHTRTAISFSSFCIITFETWLTQICL